MENQIGTFKPTNAQPQETIGTIEGEDYFFKQYVDGKTISELIRQSIEKLYQILDELKRTELNRSELKIVDVPRQTKDGIKFELCLSASSSAPIVICGKRAFILSWNDILNLAERAGLFKTEEQRNGKSFSRDV